MAAVAYHSDGETYQYAPVLSDTDEIATFAGMCNDLFGDAYRKFVTEIPDLKPNVMFTALWVAEDDLDYVRTLLYARREGCGDTLWQGHALSAPWRDCLLSRRDRQPDRGRAVRAKQEFEIES